MVKTGFFITLLGCFLFVFSTVSLPGEEGTDSTGLFSPFRFSVMGDTRPHGDPEKVVQPPMFKRAIKEINLLDPEFTVIVGDLILGYEDDDELIAREWEEYSRTCSTFRNPCYSVVGNHDVWNKWSEERWCKRHGPLYFAFPHRGCRFICLNSEDTGKMDYIQGEQLEWLKGELESHRDAKHIFVFLHKPLWCEGYHPGPSARWMEDVHPLLVEYGVNTVFAGHIHVYELFEEMDGVRYIITGGGGAEIGNLPYRGDFYHHLFVTVGQEDVRIAVIKTGSIFDQNVVTRKRVQLVNEFLKGVSHDPVAVELGNAGESVFTVAPTNVFDRSVVADFFLRPVEGSGWTCEEAYKKVTLEPGEHAELSFRVCFDGVDLFPAPETGVECSIGEEKILSVEESLNFTLARSLRVVKTPEGMRINGKLDEESWRRAGSSGRWMKIDRSGWEKEQTDWYACYNDEFIYLAVDCREAGMEGIEQVSTERDWSVLRDDCVIFYIDPVRDGTSRYCLGVNAFGVKMDYEAPGGAVEFAWDPDWDVAVERSEEGYVIEASIPLAALGGAKPSIGTEWGVNAFRLSTTEPLEICGWKFPLERLSNPAGFGSAIFE